LNTLVKNIVFWAIIIMAVLFLYRFLSAGTPEQDELTFSQMMSDIEAGRVSKVTITGNEVVGEYAHPAPDSSTRKFISYAPVYDDFVKDLRRYNVAIEAKKPKESTYLVTLLSWLPMVVLIGIWIFFMRQMQSGGNKALSFGKSKARLSSSQAKKVTFKDVAGVDEAKEELGEIIEFLKEPQKFQKLGGKIPKGVLLMGAPGTGKTLLARAISGEANVPFFCISGSDFVEMFVGVGASRVRDLFEQGKKNAPCIIFIDEIDAVGRHRGAGLGGGHDEREQTLNQLLVEMDGFESNEGVILIAATNRPDVLDPALLRPGRFDRRVVVSRPDVKGREEIIKVHTRKIPLSDDVDLAILSRGTPGFSGADLANLVNEAALTAARFSKKVVHMVDFEGAKDKVLMGSERRSLIISEQEKRLTAYHEAGHALVAHLTPHADPIHKVTIIPRGMALGVTQQLPIDDRHNYTREYLESMLSVMMGGRVSEEMFMDVLSTGAGDDLDKATEMVRKMVCEWGMSDTLGPITFGKKDEAIFLGREIAQHKDYSESTAVVIDQELKRIIVEAYDRAKQVIDTNREALVRVAEALLEFEVLEGDEIAALVGGDDVSWLAAKRRTPRKKTPDLEAEPAPPTAQESVEDLPGGAIAPDPVKQPS
jgi:cell division protease FtsH